MKKLEFDFNNEWIKVPEAQAKFDEWFMINIESAPVVYCSKPDKENSHLWNHHKCEGYDTHAAKLIDIQEIKKECVKHVPKVSVSIKGFDLTKATHLHQIPEQFYCVKCGIELIAEFKEKK